MAHTPSTGNTLLDALSAADLRRLLPQLEEVLLPVRRMLHVPEKHIEFAYFPLSGIVSETVTVENRIRVEVGVTGREGFVGIPAFLGADTWPHEIFVQVAGSALRIKTGDLRTATEQSPQLRDLLFRFTRSFLLQVAQNAACNARHSIEMRLPRWLLMAHDRLGRGADEMLLTQEFLAVMLGVQRPGVSLAAAALQSAKVIRYTHGRVAVLDRAALEAACCGCYRTMRDESRRILPHASAP